MARTDKPGAGAPQQPQQPTNPGMPAVRPQGMGPPQFATVGGYVMPQQLAQQAAAAAAAGGRPALVGLPGQPQQFMLNPQMNLMYQQQMLAAAAAQQHAARPGAAVRPGVQPAASAASAAGVRSASPGLPQAPGQPRPMAPPTNFAINLKMPTGEVRPFPISAEFLQAHPNEWPAWVANPALHNELWQKFTAWHARAPGAAMIRPPSAPAAAKRPKQEPAPSMPMGVRPPQLPTQMHAGTGGMRAPSPQPQTAAAAAAAAQATLQQRLAAQAAAGGGASARLGFPVISKPTSEEDKHFLPKPRLQMLARETCGTGARLTGDAEAALKSLAQDFVANAVAFGVSMAKRRKGEVLEQADLQLYFEHTWNLQIPGFNDAEVRPYRRPAASDIHKARLAAVRRSVADASAAAAGAGAGTAEAPAAAGEPREAEPQAEGGKGASAAPAAAVPAPKNGQVALQPEEGAGGSGGAAARSAPAATPAAPSAPDKPAAAAAAEGDGGGEENDEDMPDL